jgi:hypothetical protein
VPSGIAQPQPEPFTFAEDLFDAPRLIVQAEDRFVYFGHLTQQVDLVVQKWTVEYRNNRLGRVHRERPQPGALAPREQDRFHSNH